MRTAVFELGDGTLVSAPFPAGKNPPAVGTPCLVRIDAILEPASFRSLAEPFESPRTYSIGEFVSVATSSERERIRANEQALADVRKSFREILARQHRDALVARFRYSLRRERLTLLVAFSSFVDVRPIKEELERLHSTKLDIRALSPRDLAGAVGGQGPCGRRLCCAGGFAAADADGARSARPAPGATRDPIVNGLCGRARCCQRFEDISESPERTPTP